MNRPAVTVPPEVMPHSCTGDEDGNPGSGTTADAGTGAPDVTVTVVPAPTNRDDAPLQVMTTVHGPAGTLPSETAVPATDTCEVTIIS